MIGRTSGRSPAEESEPLFQPLDPMQVEDAFDTAAVAAGHRKRFLVPVRQPLVLVTQIQRSGGTLITQLLDGHTELHVHPSELNIGKPKTRWPHLDLGAPPEELFETLREEPARLNAEIGYQKISGAEMKNNPNHADLVLPFIFSGSLQKDLFVALWRKHAPATQRQALDHYATSYFNAWLDYAGLYRTPPPKFWVSFIAGLLGATGSLDRYLCDYPDGRVIVPVRDPVSWFASARAHRPKFAELDKALRLWIACNEHALAGAERNPGLFLFVRFEDIVRRTEPGIRRIARFLEIGFEPCLLSPTFNGMSIVSDSSFGSRFGIDRSAVDRSDAVDAAMQAAVRERTGAVYRCLLQKSAEG